MTDELCSPAALEGAETAEDWLGVGFDQVGGCDSGTSMVCSLGGGQARLELGQPTRKRRLEV